MQEQQEKKKAPRDFPWCTCCLVTSAIFCHTLVLLGNLATAASFTAIGQSTNGWSNVGLDLANTFSSELDVLMTGMTEKLTGVLDKVLLAKEQIDGAFYMIGNITDFAVTSSKASLLEIHSKGHDPSALLFNEAALTRVLTRHVADNKRRMAQASEAYSRFGRTELNHQEAAERLQDTISTHHEHLQLLQLDSEQPHKAECTTNQGVTCKFPFVYKGEHFSNCTYMDGQGEAWCATSTSGAEWLRGDRTKGEWGPCAYGCQAANKWIVDAHEEAKFEESEGKEEELTDEAEEEAAYLKMVEAEDAKDGAATELKETEHKKAHHNKTHHKKAVQKPTTTTTVAKTTTTTTGGSSSAASTALDVLTIINKIQSEMDSGGDWQGLIYDSLANVTDTAMAFVSAQLDKFFVMIHPALVQIGAWLIKFGTKIQTTIEGFGNTIDKVQKIIDQIMGSFAGSKGKADVEYNTYTLFDMSGSGFITVEDLRVVGKAYGIQALDGDKADKLFITYDQDKNGKIDEKEYSRMVEDDSIPGCMCVVLRAFSKKLAQIAGNVKAARLRDEVAKAVADYLTHISAKNKTKVQWVSNRLTNASIPMAFSADLMKQLAQALDSPSNVSTVDVGQLVITEMVIQEPKYVSDTLKLMSDPKFWESEGFDPTDQPKCVERVTKWVTNASIETQDTQALHHLFGERNILKEAGVSFEEIESVLPAMPAMAREIVAARAHQYRSAKRAAHAAKMRALKSSDTAKMLFDMFLGGSGASEGNDDPVAKASLQSGVMAVPETLEFALFLSNNASATAKRFQDQCGEYMGDTSSALDSFANQIQAMTKKMTNFLTMMKSYSTPTGIKKLEAQIKDFAMDAAKGILDVVNEKVLQPMRDSSLNGKGTLLLGMPRSQPAQPPQITQVFTVINTVLTALQGALPSVIDDLKFARKEVSAVSSQLKNIFGMVKVKGPPVFDMVASLYSTLWIVYYVFFGGLTLALLFYGFWASGYFGGHNTTANTDYEPPTTMYDKCCACWRSCKTCMNDCHDTQLCFWSCIIFMEVIVLVLFVVAIILTLLSGVKAFINSGCSQVYLLGDSTICTGILTTVQTFLAKFWTGQDVAFVCDTEKLMTCQLIAGKMKKSVIYTTCGSMLAAVLSFQMVIQSAVMHEQARWRRIADEFEKDV
mmetsp:Transcript_124506/g.219187  ORF Transcript_124506/g.219187 Transcript_124506/m.219187 type:complete len:1161 (+) Transcript_124506:95-3577(+)